MCKWVSLSCVEEESYNVEECRMAAVVKGSRISRDLVK